MKKGFSKDVAFIFGDIPAYDITCKVCGKVVSIGNCPIGHDDICIDCAVDLWNKGDSKVLSSKEIGKGVFLEIRLLEKPKRKMHPRRKFFNRIEKSDS